MMKDKPENIFPKDFLWGGALAACQAEGAYNQGGKTLTVPDCMEFLPERDRKDKKHIEITRETIENAKKDNDTVKYPKRRGINFYNTYKEDIALFAEMGFKVFRYSISWARVFPDGDNDVPNEEALKFYDNVIDECLNNNIEPLITISHFDMPVTLIDNYGGWYNYKLINLYVKYCEVLFKRYKGKVKYWITFNEINMSARKSVKTLGILNEGQENYKEMVYQGLHHQFVAAAKVTKLAHQIDSNNQVGSMVAFFTTYPYTCVPEDVLFTQKDNQMKNLFFLDVLNKGSYPYYAKTFFKNNNIELSISEEDLNVIKENTADFIGLSYYNSMIASSKPNLLELTPGNVESVYKNPHLEHNEWGWQIDPVGFRYTLNHIYDRYNVPLFVLENSSGFLDVLEDDNSIHDPYRIDFLNRHIEQMQLAIKDGVNLIGYTMWGPIDMISSGTSEMSKRYGFIYVDQDNFGNGSKKRYKKDSFYWYKDLIAKNGNIY
ncbi:6-phospho-beta-glucosidase [Halolactibacillus halophilus]|uniref:6-phospho-beta-glucosidase n=1 Tax=Halolactibacillus halophilus TaxID=306540 RepID=A0A1I5QT99_9BACI|nr:family 1 glycosylhydrolase [Halolactibacillus halophilus]GEM01913.1 6-phospho-beta-glucosidase [Halolactibacillus halophilus]SFP49479.1 6-phospho-beta-glucosidase [Halolactibacillus halophilus]